MKFRPLKPASSHLNGKVERSQKTDKEEFYSTTDLRDETLVDRLAEWQHHYNWERPHGAHHGKTPMDKYFELSEQTPFCKEVLQNYDPTKERIQMPNDQVDLRIRKLKPSPGITQILSSFFLNRDSFSIALGFYFLFLGYPLPMQEVYRGC